MSRSFAVEQRVSYSEGANVRDPLVINFSGTVAELTERSFSFDIDTDGQTDQIATPINGGFLALDRNGDGTINNGAELFGPTSGNGFSELAAYDEDGNGFVDSGDSVFDQLRIFMRHETIDGAGYPWAARGGRHLHRQCADTVRDQERSK
jgi:hypothetical protein